MDDATRRPEGRPEDGQVVDVDAALGEVAGELTHVVLGVFDAHGFVLAEQLARAGRDPLEVLDVFAVTLRALANGLEFPCPEWIDVEG